MDVIRLDRRTNRKKVGMETVVPIAGAHRNVKTLSVFFSRIFRGNYFSRTLLYIIFYEKRGAVARVANQKEAADEPGAPRKSAVSDNF